MIARLSLVICLALGVPLCAHAQLPPPTVDPDDLGLKIPRNAAVKEGSGQVVVTDSNGQPQVAKVYLEVGDTWVVIMPDGRIRSVRKSDTPLVDRPFQPLSKEDLQEQLKERFAGFQTNATKRYVYVYNTSKPFFQATSRILETMHPALVAYCKRQRLPVHDPDTPLVVIMFRTQQEYQAYRDMPAEIVAYYNTVSNYVVMYEQSELVQTAPAIAIKQSISTIAHEGVHQILHSIGVQKRLSEWPMWISEGLPEFFSPTSTDRRIRWSGVGKVNNMRMRALREHLKNNPSDTLNGELVKRIVGAKQLTATGYAASWALTDYLAKSRSKEFMAFLREVSSQEALAPQTDPAAIFEKHFGSDYDAIQKGLFAHLKKLPYVDPILSQPHFLAVVDTGTLRRVMVTSSPAAVQEWKQKVLSELPRAARASSRFNVQIFANRGLAEQAARAVLD